jgi:hypothetical protein
LIDCIGFDVSESQLTNNTLASFFSEANIDVDWLDNDVLAVHVFDFHSTETTGNNARALTVPVHYESQIDFLFDINSFMNQHSIHLQTILNSLMSDQIVTNHLIGVIFDFLRSLANLYSSLKTTG